jgi:hypothetical protein
MSTDPAIETVRAARRKISQEHDNDPARLLEHYVELQKKFAARLIQGPEQPAEDAAQPPLAPDESRGGAAGSRR